MVGIDDIKKGDVVLYKRKGYPDKYLIVLKIFEKNGIATGAKFMWDRSDTGVWSWKSDDKRFWIKIKEVIRPEISVDWFTPKQNKPNVIRSW